MDIVRKLFWWLFIGSLGGANRARIVSLLKEHPYNANQLTESLGVDYKTVRHHIDVLEKNNIITSVGSGYVKIYCLSRLLEDNIAVFDDIWEQIGKNALKGKKNRGGYR